MSKRPATPPPTLTPNRNPTPSPNRTPTSAPQRPATGQHLPVVMFLFIGSGCAALIYEVVWLQLLRLVIGSSAVSLGVLLGTFMGGMCLGSLTFPYLISSKRHPLRVYAILELGIAALGLLLLFGMPWIDRFYATHVPTGWWDVLARAGVSCLCLLLPTMLMGATLPAVSRWLETTPRGVSWLGFFYGGNTAGAVFGCLLAGFYLLRVHDTAIATYVAAAINGAVALVAMSLAWGTSHRAAETKRVSADERPQASTWTVYAAIALSGMTALGAEVIWTRQLSLLFGATVYTFSIILAVFLVGLGIGSSVGSMIAGSSVSGRTALGWCQLMLVAALFWTGAVIANSLPYWPIDPQLTHNPWIAFQLDLARCFWAVLPPALLWGASFPLALAAIASPGQDAGRLVGKVYAANTLGAIVGALAASLLSVRWLGTHGTQQAMIGLAAFSTLLVFLPAALSRSNFGLLNHLKPATGPVLALAIGGLCIWQLPHVPWELTAFGRSFMIWKAKPELLYLGEGMNASIAVTREQTTGARSFHVSGKVEASSRPEDMRVQRMLGHLPAVVHPEPKSALVVGCGAGVTAGSLLTYPSIERIVICEIEQLIPPMAEEYFGEENNHVAGRGLNPEKFPNGPKVEIVYDDARHYILTTPEKFDIITSDPIHPWVKGTATLYSTEYFQLVQQHLNPGGVVTQWVPLYESDLETVKSQVATFMQVFPYGTVWSNDIQGTGYDVALVAKDGEMKIDVDALTARLARPDHAAVAASLMQVGFHQVQDLLGTYAGQGPDLTEWLQGAQINSDRNLRLQYLAGMALNYQDGTPIYANLIMHRRFPENLFIGTNRQQQALRGRLGAMR